MLTRKLALELWVVGIAGAFLIAIAVALHGASSSADEDLGAATEGARLAELTNMDVKDFMVRTALASASRMTPAAAATGRLIQFTGAVAAANFASGGNSPANKMPL